MKRIFTLTTILFFVFSLFAKVPQYFNYQAIIRNPSGELVKNQSVTVKTSITYQMLISISPPVYKTFVAYAETHNITSNANGLITLQVGKGTPVTAGTSLSDVDFSKNTFLGYNIKTEIDPAGGTNYTISGTENLAAVPYALVAGNATNGWSTLGNGSTSSTTNFIGTTDNQSLTFKVNNVSSGIITNDAKNTAFGYGSVSSGLTGKENTSIGFNALNSNTTGGSNTAIGLYALTANTTGTWNTAIGDNALRDNVTGQNNTALGNEALHLSKGSYNIAIGDWAGHDQTSGDRNIMIGKSAQAPNVNGSNQMNIGNCIFGTGMTGSTSAPAGNIGINTTAPVATLDVNGTINTTEVNRSATGTANLIPIAYGVVNADGTINNAGSTNNFTVTKTSTGVYQILISNETYHFTTYVTQANIIGAGVGCSSSVSGNLLIKTFDFAGTATDKIFSFVVYKP